jgi:hypothetical protein
MQLAFLRPQTSIGHAIAAVTRSRFCHVEMVFSDGASFSSSDLPVTLPDGRKLPDGVHLWPSHLSYDPDPTHWVLGNFECPPEHEAIMRQWAEKTFAEGHRYDFLDLLAGQPLHLPVQDPEAYVCSESVCEAAHQVPGPRRGWLGRTWQRWFGGPKFVPVYFTKLDPPTTSPHDLAVAVGVET